jgi:hypothetical protein
MGKTTFINVGALLDEVLDLAYFHPNEDGVVPIPFYRREGSGNFVVILGENASGKSFLRRVITAVCRTQKVEMIPLSMEGRGGEYGGMRGFIYGSEEWQSTGENSSLTVLTGIRTCQGRDESHAIFWDEPDLGLSDGWAAGMGAALHDFAVALPQETKAAFVVTHNRALVERLVPAKPHYLYLGSENPPRTLEEWLARPVVARPIDQLKEESQRRFKLIQRVLNRSKGSKASK